MQHTISVCPPTALQGHRTCFLKIPFVLFKVLFDHRALNIVKITAIVSIYVAKYEET